MVEKQKYYWTGTRVAAIMGAFLSLTLLLGLVQALRAQEIEATLMPDLQVTKTVDVMEVQPGGMVNYSIVVANIGTSPAFPVVLTDTLPGELYNISALDVVGGGEYGVSGNVITWTGSSEQ